MLLLATIEKKINRLVLDVHVLRYYFQVALLSNISVGDRNEATPNELKKKPAFLISLNK